MAASSSLSSSSLVAYRPISHDVFVSFRGPDVRSGILSHLIEAFCEKAIDAYVDERLEKGHEISPALLKAIEESEISLIIFSPNYASSKWCLDELAKIIECKEQNSQIVIPVFYQIEPSDVRHQTGNYGTPFVEHEKRYDTIRVQNWRAASKKAANLSGFPLSSFKSEAKFIQEVVKCVMKILDNHRMQKYYKKLVGIDRRIAKVELLLGKGSKEVCIVGIWGPGGIGKTTIAVALFSKLLAEYRDCFCVINLEEELKKNSIVDIKMKLHSELLKKKFHEISMTLALPSYVTRRLEQTKVLILLDDVYELEHLKILIHEGKDLFGVGSIIIVTSGDKQVLCNVAKDHIYEVEALNYEEALQLFNFNAFKQENPRKEWIELSKRVVNYAHGNPLALRVLGSSLFELKLEEWESLLERLGKMPCKEIQKVLRLSYDRLEREDKKIFLFLSCFFEDGNTKESIRILLDACGFSTLLGFKNLENKALIKIWGPSTKKCIHMDNLIRKMGQEISREESFEDPSKCNHLWDSFDIRQVLMNNTGTKAIQSIILKMNYHDDLHLKPQVFKKMVNLKLLKFHACGSGQCKLHLLEGLESLPNQLRLFHWEGFPLQSFPSTFCPKNLVELIMKYSRVEKLWEGIPDLVNLKKIELSRSIYLMELPDLSKASKLEVIDLHGCRSLVEIHESIFSLDRLKTLDLSSCDKLKSFTSDVHLKSLTDFLLGRCESVEDLSLISERMEHLTLDDAAIVELPSSIRFLNTLHRLILYRCENLRYLQCISDLPPSITGLGIFECGRLQSIIGIPASIEYLNAENCESLETVTSIASMLIFQNWFDISLPSSMLSFWNCINLDEHAINNIMVFIHYKIKQFSYRFFGENGFDYSQNVQVCLPGWKVPDWFRHRARGASITIPLDISVGSMCIGFIYCIIVANLQLNDGRVETIWKFRCYIEGSDSQRVLNNEYGFLLLDFERRKTGWKLVSDHMFLEYYLKSFSNVLEMRANDHGGMHEKRVSLQFEVVDDYDGTCQVIKECGVHPIYASEYFNSDELLHLKKHNWKFLTESMESKSSSSLMPIHRSLLPRATETWKNETKGLKEVLEF